MRQGVHKRSESQTRPSSSPPGAPARARAAPNSLAWESCTQRHPRPSGAAPSPWRPPPPHRSGGPVALQPAAASGSAPSASGTGDTESGDPEGGRGGGCGVRKGHRRPPFAESALARAVLTLHFAEGADAQRVPQNVVADLHPPVVLLLLGRRHLPPGTESAHGAAGGGGGGG